MRTRIYEPPLTMADDPRLIEVFLPLRQRLWWERVNWPALAAIAMCAVFDGALILSIIFAWRRW